MPHEKAAVGHPGVELEVVVVEGFLERREAGMRFLAAQMTRGVVGEQAPGDGDQVAAVGHVVGRQVDDVDGLERAAPAEDGRRVVTEHGQVGDVAAGRHAFGDRTHQPHDTATRQAVHARRVGGLERRATAERRLRLVGHAVRHEQDAFTHHVGSRRPAHAPGISRRRREPSSGAPRGRRTWGDTARCRSSARRRRPSWWRRPRRWAPNRTCRR